VLFYPNNVSSYHSFENKNKARLHMLILNCLLNVTRSEYQYTSSMFMSRNMRDLPLTCPCSASVQQHCHLLSSMCLYILNLLQYIRWARDLLYCLTSSKDLKWMEHQILLPRFNILKTLSTEHIIIHVYHSPKFHTADCLSSRPNVVSNMHKVTEKTWRASCDM
jgi:hypothetical protein